jgi:hypothetical protein
MTPEDTETKVPAAGRLATGTRAGEVAGPDERPPPVAVSRRAPADAGWEVAMLRIASPEVPGQPARLGQLSRELRVNHDLAEARRYPVLDRIRAMECAAMAGSTVIHILLTI